MQPPDARSSSLGRRLTASVVAVNLFVAGLVAASLDQSRDHFRAEATVVGQNLARLLETAIGASFDQVDLALLRASDEYLRQARTGSIDAASFEAFMAREKARAPALLSMRATDARGVTRYNVPPAQEPVNLSDREYFAPLRDDPAAGLFVAKPSMGRIIATPVMVFARRLSAPDGSFAGVVFGSVRLVNLGEILSQVDVGAHGIVTLRWQDLSLVAQKTATETHVELGDRSVSPQLRDLVAAGVRAASYDARSTLDGVDRTYSVRRFERFPLHVVVGLARDDYLREWRRAAVRTTSLVASFALLTVLLAVFAHRAWRRRLRDEELLLQHTERLRESEELFRLAFQTNRDAINLNRLSDGVYVAVNEGFTRLSGWTEEEVLGRSSLELGVWADPADRLRLAKALASEGFADNLEARFAGKDGRTITGLMSARLITVRGEKMILSITRDITAWKEAERERDRLQEQIRQGQKLESIGQLAGGVAHDFNNLLTVILSYAEALRTDVSAGKPASTEDVEQIERAGERARDLIRQLLAFARKQVITPVRLDLGAVARSSERLLRRVLRENVHLVVEVQDGLWPVWCDPGRIEQVLVNLAVNARDAMPEGGTLTIEVRNLRVEPEAAAPDRPAGDWIQVIVHDDGVGMAPEVQAHLFEPFFTTKATGKGTGLGLATVHGIVTQSGGHIRVESEVGGGTRFEICFPRNDTAAPAAAPAPVESRPGTETILVVEDDPQVRGVTVRALQSAGYRILVASGGGAALALLRERNHEIDLLITDVVMPGMGGRAVADELRRRIPGLRVLFVSGYAGDGSIDRGVTEDPLQFLAKPFTASALLIRVRQVLDAPTRVAVQT